MSFRDKVLVLSFDSQFLFGYLSTNQNPVLLGTGVLSIPFWILAETFSRKSGATTTTLNSFLDTCCRMPGVDLERLLSLNSFLDT